MRAGKRLDLVAALDDAVDGRERRRIDLEEFRARGLARETDVGDADRLAVTEAAGLRALEMRLERRERLGDPVPAPCHAGRLVELELVLEVFAHARDQQRMRIAGDDLGEAAHARPVAGLRRQQPRMRMDLVEIFDDGEGLEQDRTVAVDQRRQRHHGIDGVIPGFALLALHQVDVDHLLGRDALEVERDADAIRRQRSPEREKLHGAPHPLLPPGSALRRGAARPATAQASSLSEVSPEMPTAPMMSPLPSRMRTPPGLLTMRPPLAAASMVKNCGVLAARSASVREPKPMPRAPHAFPYAMSKRRMPDLSSRLNATR